MRLITSATLAVILAATAVGLTAPTAQATLTGPVVVPIANATDVVADAATQQVFVSTGTSNSVVVLSWDGVVIDTLTGMEGAQGMDVDAESGTVYVAQSGDNQIAAIDTTTLAVTRYPTSGTPCPRNIAVTDGIVFYGHAGPDCSSWGGVGVLDPGQGGAIGEATGVNSLYQPQIAAAAGVMVVIEQGLSPTSPRSYAISGTSLNPLGYRSDVGSNSQDLAIAPDASEVVVASGWPYVHRAFDPFTLDTLYAYPTTNYPNAAAISDGGSLAAMGTDSSYDNDIWLFDRGTTTISSAFEMENLTPSMTLYPGGLAFGGTDRLFAIGWETYYDNQRYLMIQPLEAKQEASLSLSAPDHVRVGDEVAVTGRLGVGSEFAGQKLTVSRISDGVSTSLGEVTVQPDGTVSLADTPPTFGQVRYIARWAGDDTYAPAIGISGAVSVVRTPSTLTVTTDATTYHAGKRATVTVTLDHRDKRNGVLKLTRRDANGSRTVGSASFDKRVVTFRVRVMSAGRFVATYSGNNTHEPATAESRKFDVTASVHAVVDGYFRHDGNHWTLRPAVSPKVTWTVTPAPVGPCALATLQVMTSDGWRTLRRSLCENATTSDTFTRRFDDRRHDGTRWRVRLRAGATTTHDALVSRWTYITFRALPTADRVV